MFHLDLRENMLWRYRGQQDDERVPLEPDAGLYDCKGPIDALVEAAAAGRPFANTSPALEHGFYVRRRQTAEPLLPWLVAAGAHEIGLSLELAGARERWMRHTVVLE